MVATHEIPATRLLALETSGQSGSVAAFDGDNLLAERTLASEQRSAQSLAPAIRDLLAAVRWKPAAVEVVAVTRGPGSFTGLRVGVTTAKTFAYAIGAAVVGVNTLDCIARQAAQASGRVVAVLDAQRSQVFVREYVRDALGVLTPAGEPYLADNDAWLARLEPGVAVIGPALSKLAGRIPIGVTIVAEDRWQPRAASVGQLGAKRFAAGQCDDIWTLAPWYLRKSAAEEKLELPP